MSVAVMEIVQAEVPDDEASEVLQQVHSAIQNIQQPASIVDTNEQVTPAQLESGQVAIIPVASDPSPGKWFL